MAANMGMSPVMEESFADDGEQKDLRALSSAIMAATERAELIAHETDRWLTGHQEFDNLDIVEALVSEAEGRLIQLQQMTVLQELDRFMAEITVNAPADQASQLNQLVTSTKETFSSAIDSLERFIQRTEHIQRAYTKYKESAFTLSRALGETSLTLQTLSQHKDLSELPDQVDAIKSSRNMLNKMKSCLRNMKDAMAGIESLTLTVCDLGMDNYVKEYKQRRTELCEALVRLEAVQSQMELFSTLHDRCEYNIAELNGALKFSVTDNRDIDHIREQTEQIQLHIHDMEKVVESLRGEGVHGRYGNKLSSIRDGYASLVNNLSAVTSSSYHRATTATPLSSTKSSPRRSPRHPTPSDPGTPRQSLRKWLRSKTDELQELMSQPFPFDDKSIQSFWHTIQKYQGDLVVKGEEFSLYANEGEGDQPTMDQITPLIDTCADLSYRLDTHARLCVQYTADQNGLMAELKNLEEAKGSLQHSEIPLREQHHMCEDLLAQVNSLKRHVHDQLANKLPAISVNLAKKEGGSILTDTSELDAAVSKLKLELKAFYQSLEASISNLDLLTKQLTDLQTVSTELEDKPQNFTFTEPMNSENVTDALNSCKRQLDTLAERQHSIGKLLSKKGVAIGRLPSQDEELLDQTITQSTNTAELTISKLEQYQSNLSSLHQTVERFESRCDEAKERLMAAELLLNRTVPTSAAGDDVVTETTETVTTQCKTRLHECVTCVEQAEIAATELEQRNNGLGKVGQHKDIVKDIQAKHKTLSERLRDIEKRMAVAADNQRSLDSLMQKFDEWLETSQGTIIEQISLKSGLNDMRDHIIKLHELEKSEETTVGWISEMRKLGRSLGQTMSGADQAKLMEQIAGKEEKFSQLTKTLAERIQVLSKEMEIVIVWIQKSSDVVGRLNNMKHHISDLSNTETNERSIESKLDTLKSHIVSTEGLQDEFSVLTSSIPQAVSEKQRKSSHNAQESCDALYSDLLVMDKTLTQVDKIWSEYKHLSGEVKEHLRHCHSQLEAVKLPGVSLDAKKQRYEEICEALEYYPEGSSPPYLQELLSTCPIASHTLYSEAISVMDEHDAIMAEARKGAAKFGKELKVRSTLEANLKSTSGRLKTAGARVHNSLLLEDWSVRSCDDVLRLLQTEDVELKALHDQISPLITSQKEQHSANEEAMTLDLKECIEEFEENHRELIALLAQENEVLVLAREFCQYINDSEEIVQSWLSRTQLLCEDINNGNVPTDIIEQELQSALGDVAGMRQHLSRVSKYSEQVTDSLTHEARTRLSQLANSLTDSTNERESSLTELLDYHGEVGQTKQQHNAQCEQLEQLLNSCSDQLNAVNNARSATLPDCQNKVEQIEAIEAEQAAVQESIASLYETTNMLSKLLPANGKHRPHATQLSSNKLHPPGENADQHEKKVKALCVDRWSKVKDKLIKAKKEATTTLQLLTDVETRQKDIVGEDFERVMADITEAESVELCTLTAPQLERLEETARQNRAVVSGLWKKFLSAKDMESSLLARLGGDANKSSKTPEIGSQLSSLTSRCQKVEGNVEKASAKSHEIADSLQNNLDRMRTLEVEVKGLDPREEEDIQAQQEHLQQLKNEVTKLYQSSNEVVSSFGSQLPPDVANTMNSVQNLNESLLDNIQEKLGQAVEILEQFNVVHVIQQDLEKWMSNTMQTISSDVVDSQVALSQQCDLEEHVIMYNRKLSDFTTKSHDLENSLGSKDGQRLLETVSHFQKSFSGIKQGLDRRRSQVSQLVMEEDNFQTDLTEVTKILSTLDDLVGQEVTEVTIEKCQQLANEYQNQLKRVPQLDEKLNDLAALSIRLSDSSHTADSTTKVLDLKKDWARTKTLLTQQANALKDTTRLLLAAPQLTVSHDEWSTNQERAKAEAEDTLRDLHSKVDGSELIQTDQVMAQLQMYETEDGKLRNLTSRIEELTARRGQLQEASLDPLMLKDWAGQVTKLDAELKQLYMKSDETIRRQNGIVEKARRLAAEGVKREAMEDPIVPVPAQVLDLSMESDLCVEETRAPLKSQRPSLSQDEQASRLFTVESNPEKLQAEQKIHKMLSEQEDLQVTIADVNRQISQWQWTLDQDYHTSEELKQCLPSIQKAKTQLDELSKCEAGSHEPSLPVLSMSLETLELRCLSELQRLENNDSLTQDHRDTLDSIEEEVVACQKYLDYLDSMPGGAEEKLPGVEHKVSKLQRMFQTLELINPTLCEGSLVLEYLGQLMNDLQVLQGRLEIIPEEGDFHSHGKELRSWQEHMAHHVSQHEADSDSDTEFVDRVLAELTNSLRSLTSADYTHSSTKHRSDFLSAYKELLAAAGKGLNSSRLLEHEHASDHKESLQGLFTLFESYRLHIGTINLAADDIELKNTLSDLSNSTQTLQRDLWCHSERSGRLKDLTSALYSHCDVMMKSLTQLKCDYNHNTISQSRLERSLVLVQSEYHGLVSTVTQHLSDSVRSPELRELVRCLQHLWSSLQESAHTNREPIDGFTQLFTDMLMSHKTTQNACQKKLDLSVPLNICLAHALDLLVELDTFNWMYKDLYSDKEDVDLEIKSSVLATRPKMNAIKSSLQAKLREFSPSDTSTICKIYKWLGDIKPFQKQLPSASAIHEYIHELLVYQCNLSQRTYITGLMMSLVTSCDHEVILMSQNTVKALHEAKIVASMQLTTVHLLRDSYRAFNKTKISFERWINDVSSVCKDCPIGSQHSVTWLLQRCQMLHSEGVELRGLREELTRQTRDLSSKEMCSQLAVRDTSRHVNELLNKQETSLQQLSSLVDTLRYVHTDWLDFSRVYAEACDTLDNKEYALDTAPCLSPAESVQEFQLHLNTLKLMLSEPQRQSDRIQPLAHSLRLNVTVANILQMLDEQTKSVKTREYTLYSQKLPLAIERWLKAQGLMDRYEKSCDSIRHLIKDVSLRLQNRLESSTLRDMELSLSEYQQLLHKLDTIDWSDVNRQAAGVGQLTGVILSQATHLKKVVDDLCRQLVELMTECTELCAKSAHCAQTIHSLENKLSRMERDPLLNNSSTKLSHKTLRDRKSKTEHLLHTLLAERHHLDNLHSQTTHNAKPLFRNIVEAVTILENRFRHTMLLLSTKLTKLQEDIIAQADVNELQSSYQDWKNQAIKVSSVPIAGEAKDFEEQQMSCLLHIALSESEKLCLDINSKTSLSVSDHEQLVESLRDREVNLKSLIQKHKLFNRLKEMVLYSLTQLDSQLTLGDRTYSSHVELSNRIPKLKATFEQHQRTSLIMRQICQELLPHCDEVSRTKLLAAVQKSSSKWQSVLSKLMSQSEESMTVIANAKSLNHSLVSLAKEIGSVRQGTRGTLPEHHDHLQERQSQADVFDWRLEKINTKCSVTKFDLSALSSQVDNLSDIDICFNISQTLTEDSESMVAGLKHELNDRLSVWSSFVSDVNSTLVEMQKLEKLYMNEKHLTIEDLLEEITTKYSVQLRKLSQKAEHLISQGTTLLSLTGDLYGSAIQHGIVSLQSSMKHLARLSVARTNKLKDTMSAILEFEAGMKSLNQWLRTTEGSLNFTPVDWQEATVLANQQYLVQLEKDISHHSRTVTAVINLCSLLQYDRDAGYDLTVKQELSSVKDRLNTRWRRLCDKIISKKEQLYELGQAWSQMRSQTGALISKLQQYKEKCDDYVRSKSIRPKTHHLEEFNRILKDCEAKHEDMRLLNNRLRYLTRLNMLDTSGCIKQAVARCTELWDSAYRTLTALVKEMRAAHEAWTDFVKERDVLLAKVSNLSLILKTKPGSHESIQKKLDGYQSEADTLLDLPVSNLRASCTTEEHRKLDHLIQELTISISTLRSELRPQDDLHAVEEELELALHQTEDLERDLDLMSANIKPTPMAPTSELLSSEHTAQTTSKVADIERRVEEMSQRATIRRKLRPTIGDMPGRQSSASNESLDMTEFEGVTHSCTPTHQPLIMSPATALLRARLSRTSSADGRRTPGRSAFSRATPPFQKYLSARRRSLSRERDDIGESSKQPTRTRSLSLERSLTGERSSRGRTVSDRPLTSRTNTYRAAARSLPSTPSPSPSLSVDTVSTGYLMSVAPLISCSTTVSRRCRSPLSVRSSPSSDVDSLSYQQSVSERIQLELDMRHTMEWIDKIEVLSTSVWGANLPANPPLSELVQLCKQYNEILAQGQHFKSLKVSINLVVDLDAPGEADRNNLNFRWKEVGKYLTARQDTLVSALLLCSELKREVEDFSDDATHSELKVLSGTHTKQSIQAEVRVILTRVRSYITLFTSLLCEGGGKSKQLLDTLRICEIKCQNLLS